MRAIYFKVIEMSIYLSIVGGLFYGGRVCNNLIGVGMLVGFIGFPFVLFGDWSGERNMDAHQGMKLFGKEMLHNWDYQVYLPYKKGMDCWIPFDYDVYKPLIHNYGTGYYRTPEGFDFHEWFRSCTYCNRLEAYNGARWKLKDRATWDILLKKGLKVREKMDDHINAINLHKYSLTKYGGYEGGCNHYYGESITSATGSQPW